MFLLIHLYIKKNKGRVSNILKQKKIKKKIKKNPTYLEDLNDYSNQFLQRKNGKEWLVTFLNRRKHKKR